MKKLMLFSFLVFIFQNIISYGEVLPPPSPSVCFGYILEKENKFNIGSGFIEEDKIFSRNYLYFNDINSLDKKYVNLILKNVFLVHGEPFTSEEESNKEAEKMDTDPNYDYKSFQNKGFFFQCKQNKKQHNPAFNKKQSIYIATQDLNRNIFSFSITKKQVFNYGKFPEETAGHINNRDEIFIHHVKYDIVESGATIDKTTEENISAYSFFKKDYLFSDDFQKIYEKYYLLANFDESGVCQKYKDQSSFIAKNFLSKDIQNFVITKDKKVYFVNNEMITGKFAYKKIPDGTFHQLTTNELKKITYDYSTFTNCRNPVYIPLSELKGQYDESKFN